MSTALTMGHIMAVAAEFDIQSDIKQVTATRPKCKLEEGGQSYSSIW